MIEQIVYSHSDCFDVLDIFLKQNIKYAAAKIPVVFANKSFGPFRTLIYNDCESYSQKLISCLKQLNSTVILYQHEDMFLYKQPRFDWLTYYERFLLESPISFIRLCNTGNFQFIPVTETLARIHPYGADFFATQPTLWIREHLIYFLENAGNKTIYELESHGGEINKKLKLNGAIHYGGEPQRGALHYDSWAWPYIATAICKGKWNLAEYPNELGQILKEHSVDVNKRGSNRAINKDFYKMPTNGLPFQL